MLQINQIYKCRDIDLFNQNFYRHLLNDQYLKVVNIEKTDNHVEIKFNILESDFSLVKPEPGLHAKLSSNNYDALVKVLEKVNL